MSKSPFDPTTAVLGLYSYAEFAAIVGVFLPLMRRAYYAHRDDPTQRVPGQWMRRFGRTASKLSPIWRFSVEGEAPADIATKAYVVVANHESTADPFLLTYLPWDMRWVAKEELFKPPMVGWAMRWGGDIPLRRGDGDPGVGDEYPHGWVSSLTWKPSAASAAANGGRWWRSYCSRQKPPCTSATVSPRGARSAGGSHTS